MGHSSMTCSISGLPITGGTPVRCLLLTASPYVGDDPRKAWLPRTPPIRAEYDDYGSINSIHPDDTPIVQLWLRGLKEDVIEKGIGDNTYHDVPVPRDMTLDELLAAVRERLEVRQDAKHFWMRPHDGEDARPRGSTLRQRVERILEAYYPAGVSKGAVDSKFHVDEPVPYLVRVRWGVHQGGKVRAGMLESACAQINDRRPDCAAMMEVPKLVGVVTAGTGRYADDADLIVLPAPADSGEYVMGAQWDMASGQGADDGKTLRVSLAMIREDVWQALIAFPHSRYVSSLCDNCGQSPAYHKDGACPMASINNTPYKKHSAGTTYAHGQLFPDGVPHFFQQRWSEYVWYGLEAFKEGTRSTWASVSARMTRRRDGLLEDPTASNNNDTCISDAFRQTLDRMHKEDDARLAAMTLEERAGEETKRAEARASWDASEKRKRENPYFGDFLIRDMYVKDCQRPGAWVFRDSTPGVIGITEHLSMLIADRVDASPVLLDAIAELSAVRWAIGGVGAMIRPAASTGPQDPEWREHVRYARVLLGIAEAKVAERAGDGLEGEPAFMTYAEAEGALGGKLKEATQPKQPKRVSKAKKSSAKLRIVKNKQVKR